MPQDPKPPNSHAAQFDPQTGAAIVHTGVHEFDLEDANGNLHHYVVMEHPAGDGMGIMYDLLGLGAPTVLGLMGAALRSEDVVRTVLGALGSAREGEAEVGGREVAALFADLDLSAVGAELGRALATGKAPGLTRAILSRTHRDGRSLGGGVGGGLDLAYQANYLELITAVWRVCQINRFFPVPSMSAISSLVPALGGAPN